MYQRFHLRNALIKVIIHANQFGCDSPNDAFLCYVPQSQTIGKRVWNSLTTWNRLILSNNSVKMPKPSLYTIFSSKVNLYPENRLGYS